MAGCRMKWESFELKMLGGWFHKCGGNFTWPWFISGGQCEIVINLFTLDLLIHLFKTPDRAPSRTIQCRWKRSFLTSFWWLFWYIPVTTWSFHGTICAVCDLHKVFNSAMVFRLSTQLENYATLLLISNNLFLACLMEPAIKDLQIEK